MEEFKSVKKRLIGRVPTKSNVQPAKSDNSLFFGIYGALGKPEIEIAKIVGVDPEGLNNHKEEFTFNDIKYDVLISINKQEQIQFKVMTKKGDMSGVSKIFNMLFGDETLNVYNQYIIMFDFANKKILIVNKEMKEEVYFNLDELEKELQDLDDEMKKLNVLEKDAYISNVINSRNSSVQKYFRDSLLSEFNNTCAICGINKPELLVASHIVPFSKCETNMQRIDSNNGILLCSMHDKLFDKGYITFEDSGDILVSKEINNPALCSELKIDSDVKIDSVFNTEQRQLNLVYHKNKIFKK